MTNRTRDSIRFVWTRALWVGLVVGVSLSPACSDSDGAGRDAGATPDARSDSGRDAGWDAAADAGASPDADAGLILQGDYYVALDGDDGNPGTEALPWRTIQKGVDTIGPGQVLVVGPGDYGERVVITTSGTGEDARVRVFSQTPRTAKCAGFVIEGDYVTVGRFDIEADAVGERGVVVAGADSVDILDNLVEECPLGGIDVSGPDLDHLATHARVVGNLLRHNGQWGVHVVGSYVLVEGNEVDRTVQHHPKIEYTGFTGQDADGFRIFGDHHTIRLNYLHDLGNVEDPGNHQGLTDPRYPDDDYPHVDCIQTWDRSAHGGRPVMTDTLIERNRCSLVRASGKGVMISAVDAPARNLTIRNNIFEYRDIGVSITLGTFENIAIYNNVFKANLDDAPWGAAISLDNVSGFLVENNMMIDGHAEARSIAGSGTLDFNLVWWSNGTTPVGTPGAQPHELWGIDPLFVSYDGENGGDYHLQGGSPAIGAGTPVDGLTDDFDGVLRPGVGVTIGPYEPAP